MLLFLAALLILLLQPFIMLLRLLGIDENAGPILPNALAGPSMGVDLIVAYLVNAIATAAWPFLGAALLYRADQWLDRREAAE